MFIANPDTHTRVRMHANTHQNTHACYCSLLSYRAVRFGRLLPTLGPTPTRDRPNMAQSHEDRKRSRRECGSCGHPDRRLFAARAVRVAYGYARPPLLPPDPPRHRPDPPGPPPGGQGGRLEVGPEVNRGECTDTHRRPIVAPAARVAYGHARPPPLLARRPIRGASASPS